MLISWRSLTIAKNKDFISVSPTLEVLRVSLLFSCLPLFFIFEAVVVGLLLEVCDIYVCPGFISVSVIECPNTKQFMGDRFLLLIVLGYSPFLQLCQGRNLMQLSHISRV